MTKRRMTAKQAADMLADGFYLPEFELVSCKTCVHWDQEIGCHFECKGDEECVEKYERKERADG